MLSFLFPALRPLWKVLDKQLRQRLSRKYATLVSKFSELRDSTLDDLIDAIPASYAPTGIFGFWSYDEILPNSGGRNPLISFHSFPIERLSNAAVLAKALLQRLKSNTELGAVATSLGLDGTGQWDQILDSYSKDFVRFGIPYALERMIEHDKPIFPGDLVLAISKGEAYRVNGKPGTYDMVKVYSPHSGNPTVKEARKIWKKRRKYRYEKGEIKDMPP